MSDPGCSYFDIYVTFFFNYNLLIFSRQDLNGLVVGGEDGIIRIYRLSPEIDTKSPEVFILKRVIDTTSPELLVLISQRP